MIISRAPRALRLSRIVLAGACAALVAALAVPADGARAAESAPRAASTKVAFGTQFHGTWAELSDSDKAQILDEVAASGASWVRIDISWSMIQPKPGQFDLIWGVPQVDKAVSMAAARGLKVLGTFWLTPQWASGSSNRRVLPNNPADYGAALKFAANRWANDVHAWEVWNEPNANEFLSPPDPVAYTGLLKAAYAGAKQGNPNASVLIGGTMYVDTPWLAQAYAAGARDYFDVMAVHPYQGRANLPPSAPDDNGTIIQRVTHLSSLVTLMAANGDGTKPIWLTEFGWSTHENTDTTPVWMLGVTEQQQADYLKQTLELVQANYPQVTHAFWYTSRDLNIEGAYHPNNRGLIRRDFTPKPAMDAVACYTKGCDADAWVQGTGNTSATSSTLEVKTSRDGRYTRRAFLKLNASAAPTAVSSATLRVFVTSKDTAAHVPITAYPVADDSWAGSALTFPGPATGEALSTTTVTAMGTFYEFDVTAAVNAELNGDGIVSIALADAGLTDVRVQFASLDNANASLRPTLVVTP